MSRLSRRSYDEILPFNYSLICKDHGSQSGGVVFTFHDAKPYIQDFAFSFLTIYVTKFQKISLNVTFENSNINR